LFLGWKAVLLHPLTVGQKPTNIYAAAVQEDLIMAANPVSTSPELQLDTERREKEVMVHCVGRVTSSTSSLLQSKVRELIPEKKTIILDLAKVTYMDSSGLGALVAIWFSATKGGTELKLASLSDRLKELLHLTSLDKVFAVSRFPDTPSF
jgi:anti-sigma B factor antagonist